MKDPEKFWDRLSKNYDSSSKNGSKKPSRPLIATQKYLKSDYLVLDYGCATGKAALEISEYVNKVQGIDISSKMIKKAQEKAKVYSIKNVEFTKMEIFNEHLQVESFDTVVTYNVLHLIENVELAINRIYNLLKPGGYFISNTPCLGNNRSLWGTLISLGNKLNLLPNVQMFTGDKLSDIITQNNFDIHEIIKLDPKAINYFIAAKKL